MLRRIVALVSLLVVFLVMAPGLIGVGIEQAYQSALDSLEKDNSIKVKSISYQRRWFQSDVDMQATVQVPLLQAINNWVSSGTQMQPFVLSIHQHIKHGPFFPRITTQVFSGKETKDEISALVAGSPLFEVEDTYHWFGTVKRHLVSQGFQLVFGDADSLVRVQAITADWKSYRDGKGVKGDVDIKQAVLALRGLSLVLPTTTWHFDNDFRDMWLGQHEVKVSDVSFQDLNGESYYIYGFHFTSATEVSAENLQTAKTLHFDKITNTDFDFGPLDLTISATQLNKHAMLELNALWQALLNPNTAVEFGFSDVFLPKILSLVQSQSEIQVDTLQVQTNSGKITGNAKMRWSQLPKPVTEASLLAAAQTQVDMHSAKALRDILFRSTANVIQAWNELSTDKASGASDAQSADLMRSERLILFGLLVQDHLLQQVDADVLLALQDGRVSADDYSAKIDVLEASQRMTAKTGALLKQTYQDNLAVSMTEAERYQAWVDQIQNTFTEWSKKGYITSDQDNDVLHWVSTPS